MRTLNLSAIFMLACVCVSRGEGPSLTAFGEKGFDYAIEKWTPLATSQKLEDASVEIHATANGGGGIYFSPVLTLASYKCLLVKIRTLANNQTTAIRLALLTGSSQGSEWVINLTQLREGEWKTLELPLDSPTQLATGRNDKVNLSSIQNFQILGDWSNKPLDLEIASVVASNTTQGNAAAADPVQK